MLSIEMVAHATYVNYCLVLATVGDESQEAAPIHLLSKTHRTMVVAITAHTYFSSIYIRSDTKSAAMAANAAQMKCQSWRSYS